MCPFFIL
jgi:hypothetical protein